MYINLINFRLYKTLKRYNNLDYNNYNKNDYIYWRIKMYDMFKKYNEGEYSESMKNAVEILEHYSSIAAHICILSYSIFISDYDMILCNIEYMLSDYEYKNLYKNEFKINNHKIKTIYNYQNNNEYNTYIYVSPQLKNSRLEYLKYMVNKYENLLKDVCNNVEHNLIKNDIFKKLIKFNPYFISYNYNDVNINKSINFDCDICLNTCDKYDIKIIKCIGCGSLRHFDCIKHHFYECPLCRRSFTHFIKTNEKSNECLFKENILIDDTKKYIIKNNFLNITHIIFRSKIYI